MNIILYLIGKHKKFAALGLIFSTDARIREKVERMKLNLSYI